MNLYESGDLGAAEELAQDALVIALEQWPVQGVPDGPAAWLMATAKHRAIDLVRRRARYDRKLQEIGRDMETQAQTLGNPDVDDVDGHIGDDLLRLGRLLSVMQVFVRPSARPPRRTRGLRAATAG